MATFHYVVHLLLQNCSNGLTVREVTEEQKEDKPAFLTVVHFLKVLNVDAAGMPVVRKH
jgi:hypothetical protein